MGHFAGLFVFNDLTPFRFARIAKAQSPGPMRRASPARRTFWKTVTNARRFVKKMSIVFRVPRPSTGRFRRRRERTIHSTDSRIRLSETAIDLLLSAARITDVTQYPTSEILR
jgi:hypothetical protein